MDRVAKIVGTFVIIFAIIISIFAVCSALHTYHREATVTHVWGDEVVCVDKQGQEWSFFGEGYKTGQNITLKMHDMETTTIFDDVILDAE